MAIAVTLKGQPVRAGNALVAYFTLVMSGTYTTAIGGDPLSFSGLFLPTNAVPLSAQISSQTAQSGAGWVFKYVPGTTLNGGAVEVFGYGTSNTTGLTELATATYPTNISGDTISMRCEWPTGYGA